MVQVCEHSWFPLNFFPIHFSQSQGHQFSALGNSCTYPGASFVSTSGVWLHCHYDSSQLEHALISHAWELEAEFACVMGIIWSSNLLIHIVLQKIQLCVFLTILNWFLNEVLNTINKKISMPQFPENILNILIYLKLYLADFQ